MKYFRPLFFALILLGMTALESCEDIGNSFQPNMINVGANGDSWQSIRVTAEYADQGLEKRVTIVARGPLDDILYLQIVAKESELYGNHTIFAPALGNFLAYKRPGTASNQIETHSSFYCGAANGSILVTELSLQERYISGTFSGTVCEIGGNNPIDFTNGQFYRVKF